MSWIVVGVGLGLSVAGTAATIAGQEKAKDAQENAMAAEQIRQAKFKRDAENKFNTSLDESGKEVAEKEMGEGEQKRLIAYDQAASRPSAVSMPSNKVVAGSPMARAMATSKAVGNAWSSAVGGSQAKLGSTQDWFTDQRIKNQRVNQDLSILGNKAAGSAGVSKLELEHASHAGDGYGAVGSMLSAAGMLVGAYGATATTPTMAPLTADQTAAFEAGFGPVSAKYAATLAPKANAINTMNKTLPAYSAYPSAWSTMKPAY